MRPLGLGLSGYETIHFKQNDMKPLFATLADILSEDVTMTIVIRKTADEQLTVLTNTHNDKVKDSAQNLIAPLAMTGTPEELDNQFAELITAPIQKTTGIISSMADYEQAQAAADAAKAENKAKAEAAKKTAETLKKALDKADALAKEKKNDEAIKAYKACLALADDKTKNAINGKIEKLQEDTSGLFGGIDDDLPLPTAEDMEGAIDDDDDDDDNENND